MDFRGVEIIDVELVREGVGHQLADVIFVAVEVDVIERFDEVGTKCILVSRLAGCGQRESGRTYGGFANFVDPTGCTVFDLINAVS